MGSKNIVDIKSGVEVSLEQSVPLFAALLSLPLPEDRYPPLNLEPSRQRQKTLEILVNLFVEESERQAVCFIVEDLHWTEPTTLEFLDLLMDQHALADELGMRPLQAHCHRGLGTWYSQTGRAEQTRIELSAATRMYREMEMTFWLP